MGTKVKSHNLYKPYKPSTDVKTYLTYKLDSDDRTYNPYATYIKAFLGAFISYDN